MTILPRAENMQFELYKVIWIPESSSTEQQQQPTTNPPKGPRATPGETPMGYEVFLGPGQKDG